MNALNAGSVLNSGDTGAIKRRVKHHILPFIDEVDAPWEATLLILTMLFSRDLKKATLSYYGKVMGLGIEFIANL